MYKQLIRTGSVLLLLPLSPVLGFPLYEDTELYNRVLVCTNGWDYYASYFTLITVRLLLLEARSALAITSLTTKSSLIFIYL